MESINEILVLGRIGRDPEMKTGSYTRCTFSVATDFKKKDGDKQTTWHNVTAFGKTAENICRFFKKGDWIMVRGRLDKREYEKQDGTKGLAVEILTDRFWFMSTAAKSDERVPAEPPRAAPESYDEEVPF